jgi:hypothetical protein
MRLDNIFIVFLYFPWSSGKHAFSGSLGIQAINLSSVLFPLLSARYFDASHSHRTPSWYSCGLFLHFTALHQRIEIHITDKQITEYKSFRYA